ncbi:aminoglycoside phosphotransferase family protein [Actinacidiphila sp. bgisy160]|uniref:aminoglycoside phosphotransferase family protein n=1 Tax=Actinacidiphila sp. bgisy160 TaxID=3413796 RepID=UPI003D710B17
MDLETQVDAGEDDAPTPWGNPRWRREAMAWAREAAAARGLEPRPAREWSARLRPWSVVVRIPATDGSTVWFKANPPASAFEGVLTGALHSWAPGRVLVPLAVDTDRAWSLLPDGGPLLAEALDRPRPEGGPHYWEAPLRSYAELQRATVAHTGELTALGVPDLRPARLPELLDELIGRTDAPAGIRAVRPRFADWCAELAASGNGAALDHSDLHEGQVFTAGGRHVFFDWGDAAVAHPFTSLLVTARVTRRRHGADAPEVLARLRDAYLEAWAGRTGGEGREMPALRREVSLACRVGPVVRAHSWGRVFPDPATGAVRPPVEQLARWLAELLNEPPL